MKTLNEIAIAAFKQGTDNFGESVTGVRDELEFSSMMKYYSKTVLLVQPDGHPCTSGIGFYVKPNGKMFVQSGHRVFDDLEITPEIQSELDAATITAW
jgi:hypothetical protein